MNLLKSFVFYTFILASCLSNATEKNLFSESRKAFRDGQYQKSIELLNQINKNSYRWTLAKEEKAWAYFKLKDYPSAMSEIRSLTNEFMYFDIDLEPYLLQSLIHLYNCDYKTIFNVIKDLKRTMTSYVSGVESLSEGNFLSSQEEALNLLMSKKNHKALKPQLLNQLPRRFYLDQAVQKSINSNDLNSLKKRMIYLASLDNQKNQKMLQYLNLVEVEAIQRAFVPNQFEGIAKKTITKDKNTMIFNNDKELWADEIDKTQADINLCASKTGKTL